MQETINNCERTGDLVAYLYREATDKEARDFESHLRLCPSCRAELAAFSEVRVAINDWRQHTLGASAAPAYEAEAAFANQSVAVNRTRSALAAFREFFTLSPLWMRAATAVAALLFCALVVIAVAYFTEQPKVVVQEPTIPESVPGNPSQQAAGAKQNSIQPRVNEDETVPAREQEVIADVSPATKPIEAKKRSATRSQKRRQFIPRTLSEPMMELAEVNEYLPFTASRDEEKLPSLADIADDDN